MRSLRAVVLMLWLLAVSTSVAFAAEKTVYFSLGTNRTYLSSEKPEVRLYAQNVDVLEFRIYRVNDPVKFFQKLDDVHSFGPEYSPAERVDERTWLEKFHDWKHELWVGLRDFFRGQYSSESRAAIRDWHSGRARRSRITSSAGFAEVPILNSKQLIARWRVDLPPKYVSEAAKIPVDTLGPGAYLVEATDGTYKAYTVVLVSDVALVTKSSAGRLLAFAADRRTGAPVAGCNVTVWRKDKNATTLKTDEQGLGEARFQEAASAEEEEARTGSEWVLGQCNGNVAMVAPYSLNLSSDPARDWLGYVYTDRPVYRPTHTVHFKAILRKRNGDAIQLTSEREAEVRISGPDDKPILTRKFALSPFGGLHGEVEVPKNAALGYYQITVTAGKGSANGSFYVEEYKKPEYQVKVTPERTRVMQGEPIKATIEARYYFGEPVASANVTYVVHTSRAYTWGDEDEDVSSEEGEQDTDEYFYGEQVLEEKGALDANGRLVVTIPTKVEDKHKVDVNYRIEARVTDAANREISGHNAALATYASYHLNVRTQSYVYQQGDHAEVIVGAFNYDKKPVQAQITLELLPNRGSGEKGDAVLTLSGQTGADGYAKLSVPLKADGTYTLRAKSRSPEGREPAASAWLWVAGKGEAGWGAGERSLQIVPDKGSYHVGDTARVLIATGVPEATLLVTTEANTVMTRQIVQATGPNVTIDVPITRDDQPNFMVAALFIKDNELYQGTKAVKVPSVEERLKIDIQPAKQQFVPGESALYDVTVTDSFGKPVSAELSIGVVDDAIYAVRPDSSGDPVKAFYEERYFYSVTTENSLSFYFHGEAGKRSMELANAVPPPPPPSPGTRALAQVKAGDYVQPRVRKAFPDTALWIPDVHTDANGKATVRVAFPDSLTTWRATVRAVTMDTKAGFSTNKVLVRKNLMVRLAVPRFFRQGDEVTVSAIVHNYLPDGKQARVSLDVNGLDVLQGATRELQVPSRGEVKAEWRVRAQNGAEAKLLAKALTNEESDALELTLPVIPFGVKQSIAHSGVISDLNGKAQATIDYPQATEPSSRSMQLEGSASVAGAIFSALNYLTAYPYGCTEQTMSSFLPNVIVGRALHDLGVKSNVDEAELRKKVQAGLERLYDFQHEDGGWGWWKQDDSMVFMTAYVVAGLSQASAAGYEVRPQVITKGNAFLHTALQQHPNMVADLRAYVIYALALDGNLGGGDVDSVWKKKSKLSAEGVALAGLAMKRASDGRVNEAVQMLENTAKAEGDTAYWPSSFDPLLEIDTDNSVEATAFAVKLFSSAKPESPLLPKAVQWMMRHRNEGYYWDSTKQTAMVLYGVTDYLKASSELQADFTMQAVVNGKPVLSKKFTPADATSTTSPSAQLGPESVNATNAVEFTKSGAGRLYWSANAQYYSTDKKLYQFGTYSLNILRDYYRLVPQNTGEKVVYDVQPLNGPAHVGDVLAVRIVVSGGKWKYLLMEDPIPAGTEFIERDDLYQLKQKPSWWAGWYSRREFHDDRAAIFQTYFDTRREYFYLLKVVNPGKFRVSPASVQPMYQPSVLSTSEPFVLEVQ